MSDKPESWDSPLTLEQKNQLDLELIKNLNQLYDSGESDLDLSTKAGERKHIVFRIVSLFTALFFIALMLGGYFNFLTLPNLGFLAESWKLEQIPRIKQMEQAVVMVKSSKNQGTGFNIDSGGLVVTNYHVIKGAGNIRVNFSYGPIYTGQIVQSFPEIDLALIKIPGKNLPVSKMEYHRAPDLRQKVTIIGNPLGLFQIIANGEVLGLTRVQGINIPVLAIRGPIHPGNSGSPVFNQEGKVIAVIFATLNSGQDKEIVGLAVPVSYLNNQVIH